MKKTSIFLSILLVSMMLFSGAAMATSIDGNAIDHAHTWDYGLRECTECEETHPCWNEDEMSYVHDFTDSEICLVCGAELYCGVDGHEKDKDHKIATCGIPGHFACDEENHAVYNFDTDAHTQCLGELTHTCDDCGDTYNCSRSNSHCRCIKCGESWCYKSKGDHAESACGHRYCEIYGEKSEHEICEGCGEYLCDGKDHSDCVTKEEPTEQPTTEPTVEPTTEPTTEPTIEPTAEPTAEPTVEPSSVL